jgi:hypothetical protein
MQQLTRLAGEAEPSHDLIEEIKRKVSIDAFCELVAAMFAIGPGSGEQVVEMCFQDGGFRWSRVHSGRIGRDQLDRQRGPSEVTRSSDEPGTSPGV